MKRPHPAARLSPLLLTLLLAACTADSPTQPATGSGSGAGDRAAATPDVAVAAPDTAISSADADAPGSADAASDDGLPRALPTRHEVPVGGEDLTFLAGPWIVQTTDSLVALAWETEVESDTRVEYGPLDSDAPLTPVTGEAGQLHRVTLDGLEPATLYRYRACSGDACTADLSFSTAPAAGQHMRFAVYGDSRSDPPQHRAVVEGIIESAPNVVLHTGDIVEHGGERDQYREMHLDPARQLGHHVPIFVAIGNHEWKDLESEVQNFRDYLPYPREETHVHPGLSYAVRFGDAFFLMLDNTLDGLDLFFPLENTHDQPLWAWIQQVLASEAAQTARWRFAFFHYPPGSPCHEEWPMIIATRDHLLPALRDAGWDAVFAGHVHDYERHDYDGFPVIITGGGGAGLEPIEECTYPSDTLLRMESVHHHVRVDLRPESAWIEAVDVTGEIFDTLELVKPADDGR